jgi:large subunit ribosomal protein L29
MKAKDLRERSTEDLVELKSVLKKDWFSHRMKNYTGQLDDTSLLNKNKKDIARIEQILHERARAAATQGGSES